MLRIFDVRNEDQRENLECELTGKGNNLSFFDPEVESAVKKIVQDVAQEGDRALLDFTRQFDGAELRPEDLKVRESEFTGCEKEIDEAFKKAFKKARQNITEYHSHQKARLNWSSEKEKKNYYYSEVFSPLHSVGAYVPGGLAPLVSTILMTCIPAKIAGVSEIRVATPPGKNGTVNPYILYACKQLEVDVVYKMGGAQAIAALAFGTETVKKVDKICGPGNKYVTEAKRQVFGCVGIDMLAGPSEVCIMADKSAKPEFIAADILSQAEHDPDSRAILLTNSRKIAEMTCDVLKSFLQEDRRKNILEESLKKSLIVITEDMEQAYGFVQEIAPEHLEIMVSNISGAKKKNYNAGAVFLGAFTPVVTGDLFAGPNHVLPTERRAKFFNPLGVYDFIRRHSQLYYSEEKLVENAADIMKLAEIEELPWHRRSVEVRLPKKKEEGETDE